MPIDLALLEQLLSSGKQAALTPVAPPAPPPMQAAPSAPQPSFDLNAFVDMMLPPKPTKAAASSTPNAAPSAPTPSVPAKKKPLSAYSEMVRKRNLENIAKARGEIAQANTLQSRLKSYLITPAESVDAIGRGAVGAGLGVIDTVDQTILPGTRGLIAAVAPNAYRSSIAYGDPTSRQWANYGTLPLGIYTGVRALGGAGSLANKLAPRTAQAIQAARNASTVGRVAIDAAGTGLLMGTLNAPAQYSAMKMEQLQAPPGASVEGMGGRLAQTTLPAVAGGVLTGGVASMLPRGITNKAREAMHNPALVLNSTTARQAGVGAGVGLLIHNTLSAPAVIHDSLVESKGKPLPERVGAVSSALGRSQLEGIPFMAVTAAGGLGVTPEYLAMARAEGEARRTFNRLNRSATVAARKSAPLPRELEQMAAGVVMAAKDGKYVGPDSRDGAIEYLSQSGLSPQAATMVAKRVEEIGGADIWVPRQSPAEAPSLMHEMGITPEETVLESPVTVEDTFDSAARMRRRMRQRAILPRPEDTRKGGGASEEVQQAEVLPSEAGQKGLLTVPTEAPVVAPEPPVVKRPWEMTKSEFDDSYFLHGANADASAQIDSSGKITHGNLIYAGDPSARNVTDAFSTDSMFSRGEPGKVFGVRISDAGDLRDTVNMSHIENMPNIIAGKIGKLDREYNVEFSTPGGVDPHRYLVEEAAKSGEFGAGINDYPDLVAKYGAETPVVSKAKQRRSANSNWREVFDASTNSSRRNDILRAIADISKSDKELSDIVSLAEDMVVSGDAPDAANTMWAVMQNKSASQGTRTRAESLRNHIEILPVVEKGAANDNASAAPEVAQVPSAATEEVAPVATIDSLLNDIVTGKRNHVGTASEQMYLTAYAGRLEAQAALDAARAKGRDDIVARKEASVQHYQEQMDKWREKIVAENPGLPVAQAPDITPETQGIPVAGTEHIVEQPAPAPSGTKGRRMHRGAVLLPEKTDIATAKNRMKEAWNNVTLKTPAGRKAQDDFNYLLGYNIADTAIPKDNVELYLAARKLAGSPIEGRIRLRDEVIRPVKELVPDRNDQNLIERIQTVARLRTAMERERADTYVVAEQDKALDQLGADRDKAVKALTKAKLNTASAQANYESVRPKGKKATMASERAAERLAIAKERERTMQRRVDAVEKKMQTVSDYREKILANHVATSDAMLDTLNAMVSPEEWERWRTDPAMQAANANTRAEMERSYQTRSIIMDIQKSPEGEVAWSRLSPVRGTDAKSAFDDILDAIANGEPLFSVRQADLTEVLHERGYAPEVESALADAITGMRRGALPSEDARLAAQAVRPVVERERPLSPTAASAIIKPTSSQRITRGDAVAYNIDLEHSLGRGYVADYQSAMLANFIREGIKSGDIVVVESGKKSPPTHTSELKVFDTESGTTEQRKAVVSTIGGKRLYTTASIARFVDTIAQRHGNIPETTMKKLLSFTTTMQLLGNINELATHIGRIGSVTPGVYLSDDPMLKLLQDTLDLTAGGKGGTILVGAMEVKRQQGTADFRRMHQFLRENTALRTAHQDAMEGTFAAAIDAQMQKTMPTREYLKFRQYVFTELEPGMRVLVANALKRDGMNDRQILEYIDGMGMGSSYLLGQAPYWMDRYGIAFLKWSLPSALRGAKNALGGVDGDLPKDVRRRANVMRMRNLINGVAGAAIMAQVLSKAINGKWAHEMGAKFAELPITIHGKVYYINLLFMNTKQSAFVKALGIYDQLPFGIGREKTQSESELSPGQLASRRTAEQMTKTGSGLSNVVGGAYGGYTFLPQVWEASHGRTTWTTPGGDLMRLPGGKDVAPRVGAAFSAFSNWLNAGATLLIPSLSNTDDRLEGVRGAAGVPTVEEIKSGKYPIAGYNIFRKQVEKEKASSGGLQPMKPSSLGGLRPMRMGGY